MIYHSSGPSAPAPLSPHGHNAAARPPESDSEPGLWPAPPERHFAREVKDVQAAGERSCQGSGLLWVFDLSHALIRLPCIEFGVTLNGLRAGGRYEVRRILFARLRQDSAGRTLFAVVHDSKELETITAPTHRLRPSPHHLGTLRRLVRPGCNRSPGPLARASQAQAFTSNAGARREREKTAQLRA